MTYLPTVLIIEDSSTQAKLTAGQLAQYKINVLIAEDGVEGLRCVHDHRPDLIVLDINLPKMDGYQVCYRLKRDETTRDIPVIMLTDNDGSQDAFKGLDAGALDYIPKDRFAIKHLLSTLQMMGLLEVDEVDL
jgi:DNA-binding response OmpR family regulator